MVSSLREQGYDGKMGASAPRPRAGLRTRQGGHHTDTVRGPPREATGCLVAPDTGSGRLAVTVGLRRAARHPRPGLPAESLLRTWSEPPDRICADDIDGERRRHQEGLDRLQAGFRERLGEDTYRHITPRCHLTRGPTGSSPEQAAQLNADLAILDRLKCPVLAVKPPGFTSPVRLER